MAVDLREEWASLRARRPNLAAPLSAYDDLFELWACWPAGRPAPLDLTQNECAARWARGVPLLAESPPALSPDDVEESLGAVMDRVLAVRPGAATGLRRLAEAWDRGQVAPACLLPARGRVGAQTLADISGLPAELLAFISYGSLRPALDGYFAPCRPHLDAQVWEVGVCPFCGAPAGFSDVLESGRRRLACHLCGGGWIAPRTGCPFCGNDRSQDLARLEPTDRDQGYVVVACLSCRGYLKELDRRVRWDGGSALVEDWGSPHLDVVAERAGYWRPSPTLLRVA